MRAQRFMTRCVEMKRYFLIKDRMFRTYLFVEQSTRYVKERVSNVELVDTGLIIFKMDG
jgi:hypothetical protein